ncbi:NAD(P)/FAD-dependent oxidoreductase [Deinococcus pimensis]|uniref:NAD(P)/FAD-dependent oxidoreductase n=1 Tax=Deinococcus pimensis TaxID=309888 RepID=UPI00048498F2|nr:NAD(P)/FAD-dependent oxidoreductase [Deinococcus pimensis]
MTWDCVIVGAGPAGLSAAVYMGRFRRKVLLVDSGRGRWSYGQRNENYLGFPRGVSARRLHHLGVAQAERFGVELCADEVERVTHDGELYTLTVARGEPLRARTVIWAAGVRDLWPDFPGARRLVGKQLFWCIVCDGWRTLDRRVVLLGNDDHAAGTVLQFLTYTPHLTMVVDPDHDELSARALQKLRQDGVRLVRGRVRRAVVRENELREVLLADGERLEADLLFSLYGSRPNTAAIAELGVDLARNGHVRINEKNQTNLETFFAAGDVTNKHGHQVASAVHEGAQAAQAANHVLYPERQQLPALARDG